MSPCAKRERERERENSVFNFFPKIFLCTTFYFLKSIENFEKCQLRYKIFIHIQFFKAVIFAIIIF